MAGGLQGVWAKRSGDPPRYHPLADHCIDVGVAFRALLEVDSFRRIAARFLGRETLSAVQIDRLSFLAALHDLGKLNHRFQEHIREGRRGGGHVGPAVFLLCEPTLQCRALEVLHADELAAWFGSLEDAASMLCATWSHHGKPAERPDLPRRIWEPSQEFDPVGAIAELRSRIALAFPAAFEPASSKGVISANPAFQHFFNGLVTLADWIGSDTDCFPYSKEGENRIATAPERARDVVAKLGLNVHDARTVVAGGLPPFQEMFAFDPRPLQEEIDRIPLDTYSGIALLEAETGSGKTEAAFRHFMRLFQADRVDGMYFALPTRSAATQLHSRIHHHAKKVFQDRCPPVVLAVPGYIRVDDQEGKRLAPFDVQWPDDRKEVYRLRGWASEHPKRYLAGPIVVGTVDQILLSTLRVRHAHMRAAAVSRLLLVADEVHASDPYMSVLLNSVLKRHLSGGGHALLMSATLGSAARSSFLRNDPIQSPDKAVRAPYPALWYGTKGGPECRSIHRTGAEKRVHVDLMPSGRDADGPVRRAIDHASRGARVLLLRNLVADANGTQRALERAAGEDSPILFRCNGVPAPHHGRFAAEDRKLLDREVEKRFGPEGDAKGTILVATQTVEQSLDVDFDVMITDLCPGDVLLQRIGRVHRHAHRARPSGYDEARVTVLVPEERDLTDKIQPAGPNAGRARGPAGIGTVYEDLRILEATWRFLDGHAVLKIPEHNRFAVEECTHPNVLECIESEGGDEWITHGQTIRGIGLSQSGAARLNLLRTDAPFGSDEILFGDEGHVATRLGEQDRLVTFAELVEGPFMTTIRNIRISHHLARDVPADAIPEDVRSEDTAVTFRLGSEQFRYGRFGLEKDHEQPNLR